MRRDPKRDNPDGSATIAFTGLVFAIPGSLRAYVNSGRNLIVFSEDGVQLPSSVGPSADLREALAATISSARSGAAVEPGGRSGRFLSSSKMAFYQKAPCMPSA